MEYPRTEAGLFVGCSVIGPKHIDGDLPNQDNWNVETLDGGRYVIAVADGLGEADLAHKGSETATTVAVETLTENIDPAETAASVSEESIKHAITSARSAISRKADELDVPVKELETTLLVAVAGPTGVVGATVGDGGIVCDIDGEYQLLTEREESILDLKASHITVPVMQDNWEDSYRFNSLDHCDGVAVFSDGLEEFTWEGAGANPDFFDSVFALIRDHDDSKPATDKLKTALTDHPYQEFGDDKTIVITDLPSSSEANEVETASGQVYSIDESIEHRDESSIFTLENSAADAVRVYSAEKRDDEELQSKLRTMVNMSPNGPSNSEEIPPHAWPETIVESTSGDQFLGYKFSLPPENDSQNILKFAEDPSGWNANTEATTGFVRRLLTSTGDPDEDTKVQLYSIVLNLARLVERIHDQGHAFGNLYHKSLSVEGTRIHAADYVEMYINGEKETFEGEPVPDHHEPVEEITARLAELQKADRFDLATIVFQLLMNGFHPFEAEGSAATTGNHGERIDSNDFPYRDPQPGQLEPPTEAPMYDDLPEKLQSQFNQCFIEGKNNPDIRPTAEEWADVLRSLIADLE